MQWERNRSRMQWERNRSRLGYRGWRGTRYRDNDGLKVAEEAWFGDQPDNFYTKGIYCLKESGPNALK